MIAKPLPILAITMGDAGGIGSEIAVKALSNQAIYDVCRPMIVGDAEVLEDALRFCDTPLTLNVVEKPEDGRYALGTIDIMDLKNLGKDQLHYQTVTAAQGKAAFEYIAKAIDLALKGEVHATVTGPINKEALNLGGFHYSGHTEIYADLTKTRDYTMMLVDEGFRVVHVSTHVSLREACDRTKTSRIMRVIELANKAVGDLGIENPRIGVCGLNPHCGEARMFGTEDEDEIRPAVEQAVAKGFNVEGPLPADTIFSKMKGGMFDIVVAMYHDQGHIPAKLNGFHYDAKTGNWGQMAGINVTLGLPIIRTSVDHGTAYDRSGEGRANEQSMIEAILLGAQMGKSRV